MTDPDGPYADLGAIAEIAGRLGVSRDLVKYWILNRESNQSPAPVLVLTRVKIYLISEWVCWFAIWKITRSEGTWWPARMEKPSPIDKPSRAKKQFF